MASRGLLLRVSAADTRLLDGQLSATIEQASPVLVIGMHRSGTRLLDRILDGLGIFMGADRQADGESATFIEINETIFQQCGTFWTEPMPVHFVLSDPELLERAAAVARDSLTERLGNYAGRAASESGVVLPMAQPFGWKDPRNTFTLPVWRRLFPRARAIHVLRNGVDVAASLASRHGAALRAATGESHPPALTVIKDPGVGVLSSRRGFNLTEAFTMWEQYVEKARLESAEMGDAALEIRFEELVRQPETLIPAIAEFCGVAVSREAEAVAAQVDASRAFAYRRDPALVAFAGTVREALARHGYAP